MNVADALVSVSTHHEKAGGHDVSSRHERMILTLEELDAILEELEAEMRRLA
jgi:truncated hemoglobin YjbI